MANAWKKMGSLRGPAGAGADVATSKKAGVVKPSGDFDITADGTPEPVHADERHEFHRRQRP